MFDSGLNEQRDALATVPGDGPAGPTGPVSSYDALPIPPAHLREWRDTTLGRIRELPRRRVLEIGAGTGKLLARLARDAEVREYWATGSCTAAVAALTARVEADPVLREKVRLECRGAEDTHGLPAGHFDTIVVDSVVPSFPGLAHLRTVVERLLPLLAPGGSLFLGGLRTLDLAHCFRTGTALARPGAARGDREALRRRIDREVAEERELLLSPALFDALARDLPAVRAVDVRVRRGVQHNELTRYRYDAVLSTAEPAADLTAAPRARWGEEITAAAALADHLRARRPAVLRLAAVPNRRVHDEYAAMQSLFDPLESIDLAPQDAPAPAPEVLCRAAERLGYRALPTWGERPDLLDIVLLDPGQVPAGPLTGVYAAPVVEAADCANTPATDHRPAGPDARPDAGPPVRLPKGVIPSARTAPGTLPPYTVRAAAPAPHAPSAPSAPTVTAGRPAPRARPATGIWAGADTDAPPSGGNVASLFAAQVARAPGALALPGLDYAELDARSDLLAHALLEHRAGPGTCVLTALSSPAGFAVAALAVVKTGAALLPVDPALDLADAPHPAVLLLDETADLLLPAVPGAARLVREEAAGPLPPAGHWPVTDADRLRPPCPGDPLLLVPGEDGTVAVGGEAVAAAAQAAPADTAWLVRGYPDGDAAIGLLSALVCGARVHVPDGSLTRDVPHEVLGWLRRRGARMVLGGADDVLGALLALARAEGAGLSVSGGWAEGRLVVEQLPGSPPRPAPGYRAYLLDALLRPVGPGGTGSLYIAGAGVAQGYAEKPGADGERFLPDPFGGPGGGTARMWRTGRAARLDADGSLRVLDGPAHDDPFTDEHATFVVLADATGHRALWPATAAIPEGWHETHGEDAYAPCLGHLHSPLDDGPGDGLGGLF
ncbi:AMP-binding protein [Streptomyces sp. CNZ748]|uniref:AMP-binding protein n=1 Tax=Streptomyces sp. CNZ748 TaxID=2885160 RepID=UPI001E284026|nr:AMP-binding protein [Streptomyces sp. CNZ748]